jgi:hypothetical protein
MKTNDLQLKIEALVRAHLAEQRAAAVAAVERAFAAAATSQSVARARRPDQTIAALADRLFVAVEAAPDASIAALATTVGVPARELGCAMRRLKIDGRVRAVGRTQRARYFPLTA